MGFCCLVVCIPAFVNQRAAVILGGPLAVGHPRGVPEVEAGGMGIEGEKLPQDRESAETAIEQAHQETQGDQRRKSRIPAATAWASRLRWLGLASRGASMRPVTKPISARAAGITVRRIT